MIEIDLANACLSNILTKNFESHYVLLHGGEHSTRHHQSHLPKTKEKSSRK